MRSILKLMWANIRRGRGSFKGIAFLMMLITFSFSGTVSNDDRLTEARIEKFEQEHISDIIVEIHDDLLTDDMLESVRDNEHVTNVGTEQWLYFANSPELDGKEAEISLFVGKDGGDTRVFSDDGRSFINDNTLSKGEIYLPYKLKNTEGFKKGAEIAFKTSGGFDERFTVKGFYEDVIYGANTVSRSRCLVSAEDFERIKSEKVDSLKSPDRNVLLIDMIGIDSRGDISTLELRRELGRETDLISTSISAMTKDYIVDIIEMYSNVGTRTTLIFVVMLLIVILITMHNSISASIEMEYTELGILKSQGFTQRQISLVYIFQYVLALVIGAILGILVSIPACYYLIGMWKNITGLMTCTGVSIMKCAVLSVAIILVCIGFTFFSTSKIAKISPVRAISGGGSDVHFDSRLNTKIHRSPLSFFLALRQLNSRRRNYIGTMLIVSLLVFFIVSIMILTRGLDTDSLFYDITGSISISRKGVFDLTNVDDIESEIRKIDSEAMIETESYHYMLLDDEQTAVHAYRSREDVFKPMQGRVPKYDNEIMITEGVSEQCGKKIGDTVTLKYLDNEEEFVITGYFQTIWDFGLVTQITPEAMKKMGNTDIELSYVKTSDESKDQEIIDMLNDRFGNDLWAEAYRPSAMTESFKNVANVIMNALTYGMYVIILSFAAVIVAMVCKRAFITERTDIGIYKAVGFTAGTLRMQFALRFTVIALFGAAIGSVLSMMWSRKVLTYILRIVGLTDFTTDYAPALFIIPAASIALCFFITSYFSAGRVKSVEVRELITE